MVEKVPLPVGAAASVQNPFITIIVPVYNVEELLDRCVSSLVRQDFRDIEIILVDDGSTDSSGNRCDTWQKQDSRITVLHKANGGLSSARNAGINIARGEYILFVDSDDYILDDSCKRFAELACRYSSDIIAGDAVRVEGEKKTRLRGGGLEDGKLYDANEFVEEAIKMRCWEAASCLNLYKRSFLLKKGLLFADGMLHEDMEMQPRVFLSAETIAYLDYPFYQYVERSGSITTGAWSKKRIDDMKAIYIGWKHRFDIVSERGLQKLLYGHLAKCFLHTCRQSGQPLQLGIKNFGGWFLIKYGLDVKEKVKAVAFILLPHLYCTLGR